VQVTCEPTEEVETYNINGGMVPLQTWIGTTGQGIKVELLVFAVIPARADPVVAYAVSTQEQPCSPMIAPK
jgi:hypothetical protein